MLLNNKAIFIIEINGYTDTNDIDILINTIVIKWDCHIECPSVIQREHHCNSPIFISISDYFNPFYKH